MPSHRASERLLVVAALIVCAYLGWRVQNWESFTAVVVVGLMGMVFYRQAGTVGLLILLAAMTWYPIRLAPLERLLGPLTEGLSVTQIAVFGGAVLAVAIPSVDSARRRGIHTIIAVLIVAVIGWALTLLVIPSGAGMARSSFYLFRSIVYYTLIPLLCLRVIETPKQAERVGWAILFSITVYVSLILLDFYVWNSATYATDLTTAGRLHAWYVLPGASSMGLWAPQLSSVLSTVVPLALIFWVAKRMRLQRVAAIGISLLLVIVMAWTFGRAGWFGMLGAVLIMLWCGRARKIFSLSRFSVPVVMAVGLGIWLVILTVQSNSELAARLFELANLRGAESTVFRLFLWRSSIGTWLSNPLTGAGFGATASAIGYYEHNAYLALLNGVGPIGLLAYLSFWIWAGYRCWLLSASDDHMLALFGLAGLGSLVATLITAMAEFMPFYHEASWFILGIALALSYMASDHRIDTTHTANL